MNILPVAKLMKIAQKQICKSLYLKLIINISICQCVSPKNNKVSITHSPFAPSIVHNDYSLSSYNHL